MRQGRVCSGGGGGGGVADLLGKFASGDKGLRCRLTNRKTVDNSWRKWNALVLHNSCVLAKRKNRSRRVERPQNMGLLNVIIVLLFVKKL